MAALVDSVNQDSINATSINATSDSALAALGEKERALDDAVEALALNLLGTELDYARMVSSADSALKTASLLIQGVEPEEGPVGW